MEHANQEGVTFFETINTQDRAEHNDKVSCDEYAEDSASLFGIVEKDLWMGESVDSDASHSETDKEDNESSKTRDSFETANQHV